MNTPFYSLFNSSVNVPTSTAMTCTIAALASGNTRQSTLIVNSYGGENQYLSNGTGYTSVNMATNGSLVRVYFSIQVNTTTAPNNGGNVNFYLIQNDGSTPPTDTTDGAGASDAAWTPVTAAPIYTITVVNIAGYTYKGSFLVPNPGPTWGIGVQNLTGQSLNAGSLAYITEAVQSRF